MSDGKSTPGKTCCGQPRITEEVRVVVAPRRETKPEGANATVKHKLDDMVAAARMRVVMD